MSAASELPPALACGGCGREIVPCPLARQFGCGGWVHAADSTHSCDPGGAAEAGPAAEKPWPVSGRDQPRPAGEPVACDVRIGPGIPLACEPHGWHLVLKDKHSPGFLLRAINDHITAHGGEPL